MVQSESKESKVEQSIEMPRRTFTIEFFVGLFALVAFAAAGYLAVGLGGLEVNSGQLYNIKAEFDNISGLKNGAPVEIAGVKVGEVSSLIFQDPVALVEMKIRRDVRIQDDDIASIRTKGIIGDRYVKISRGSSAQFIPENGMMTETESAVDIEDIIGKFIHNMEGNKDEADK